MVTTTNEPAGTPCQATQTPSIDDFRSLLAAVPPAKADALKERIYDWLEKRERDAEAAIVKARARATIVEEQNQIVRMELQDLENSRLSEEEAATKRARTGLFAEAMSALNTPDRAGPKEGYETMDEDTDDQGIVPFDYQQPTDSSATTHALQPLGRNIGKKVHAGDATALDFVIKELLDEVMQLREGASANVARIIMLEEQLQAATDALATHSVLLDEALSSQREPYKAGWGTEASTSPRNPDPAPIRGYLDDDSAVSPHEFDACFKQYASMMLYLQLKSNGEPVTCDELPWPVLPYNPEDKYPVPRWRARYASKEQVHEFMKGFLSSKHAEVWHGSMRHDWLDLLGCKYEDSIKVIVETMVSLLDQSV